MRRSFREENDTFWISYADLMAGLLFVFVLLVGAIIVKYLFVQQDVKMLQLDLLQEKEAYELSQAQLKKRRAELENTSIKLEAAEQEALKKALEIRKLRRLKEELEARNSTLDLLNSKLQSTLLERGGELDLTRSELESSERAAVELTQKLLNAQEENRRFFSDLQLANRTIESQRANLELQHAEVARIGVMLLQKSEAHQALVEELNITKLRIKHLTGMRINVVRALKEAVGKNIRIDPKSGAIRFSSGVLFDQGQAVLKPGAKEELKAVLHSYIRTLLENPEIAPNIDSIIIEGHTNSDGSYLYNLTLSQQRAYAVMSYLLSLEFPQSELLRKLLSASGRSYSDLIKVNGKEDKDASRRIEIKFRLKEEETMRQIEKMLEKGN